MKRLASASTYSFTSGPYARGATLSGTALLLGVALIANGCIGGCERSGEHQAVSFGISPSGDVLVFNATGKGGEDLFLLDLKTYRVSRIATTPDCEVEPEFSPDGKSVVYAARKPNDRAAHIFLRSLDGKTVKQLTSEDANDLSPAFSPNGALIVFTRDKTYNWGGLASNWNAGGVLCVMNTDGTGLRQITRDDSMAIDPHFSPDGRTILFWNESGLFTVLANGSEPPKPLGVPKGQEPSYAPDGLSIAYSGGHYSPDHRVVIAKSDGTGPKKLTSPAGVNHDPPDGGCFHPVFTPDGRRVIFFVQSWPTGAAGYSKESLWEIDLERGDSREIADYTLFDDPLNWRPKPQNPTKKP